MLLSGCAVGRPTSFTARSNSFCSDSLKVIAGLKPPSSPLRQIQYATDRYTTVEKTVSELSTSRRPGGEVGAELEQRWLGPARASLLAGRTPMTDLRDAVHGANAPAASTAFASARNAGTQGVDTALLRSLSLTDCAELFTPVETPGAAS